MLLIPALHEFEASLVDTVSFKSVRPGLHKTPSLKKKKANFLIDIAKVFSNSPK